MANFEGAKLLKSQQYTRGKLDDKTEFKTGPLQGYYVN